MDLSFGIPTLTRTWHQRASASAIAAPPLATPSSGSDSVSIGSRQTEALLPTVLTPVVRQSPNQEVSGNQEESQSTRADQLRDAAAKANQYMQISQTYLHFVVSEQTGHVVVNVVNSETKEVVREIPPETLNRIANRSTQLQGLLFEGQG